MPAILAGRMSHDDWTSFCSKIDKSLEPLQNFKQTSCLFFFAIWGVAIMIFSFVGFVLHAGFFPGIGVTLAYLMFWIILLFLLMYRRYCRVRHTRDKVLKDLNWAVESEGAKRSDVCFHVREDVEDQEYRRRIFRYYIECTAIVGEPEIRFPIVTAPAGFPSTFDWLSEEV